MVYSGNKTMQNTTIKISKKLKDYLIKNSVNKTQSYEDVIWMLIGTNTHNKSQSLKSPMEEGNNKVAKPSSNFGSGSASAVKSEPSESSELKQCKPQIEQDNPALSN